MADPTQPTPKSPILTLCRLQNDWVVYEHASSDNTQTRTLTHLHNLLPLSPISWWSCPACWRCVHCRRRRRRCRRRRSVHHPLQHSISTRLYVIYMENENSVERSPSIYFSLSSVHTASSRYHTNLWFVYLRYTQIYIHLAGSSVAVLYS